MRSRGDRESVVEALVESDADLDINHFTERGADRENFTALTYAVAYGYKEVSGCILWPLTIAHNSAG